MLRYKYLFLKNTSPTLKIWSKKPSKQAKQTNKKKKNPNRKKEIRSHFKVSCISNLMTQFSVKHAVTVTNSF